MKGKQAAQTNKAKKEEKELWPPIREHTSHGKTYWLIDAGKCGGTRRQRFVCKTKGEAEKKAAELRATRASEGRDALTVPKAVRLDAGRAAAKLRPYGASLTDAAEFYVEHFLKFKEAPNVKGLADRMVADAEKAKRRARTVDDLSYRLGTFARDHGDRQLASITLAELQEWLDGGKWSARNRINFATKLSQLWGYAVRHGWADKNVAALLNRPDAEDGEPGILSPVQADALLKAAVAEKDAPLLPFVALGLFAGLRTAELGRLRWDAVRLAEGNVIVGAEVAKKRSRRVVEINPALAAWLQPWALKEGWVIPWRDEKKAAEASGTILREQFKAVRVAAVKALRKAGGEAAKHAEGLAKWPHNALRHSFGSYSLALSGDAVKVAAAMGNDASMVHKHYKALVTKAEAERFFALRPAQRAGVLPFAAAVRG